MTTALLTEFRCGMPCIAFTSRMRLVLLLSILLSLAVPSRAQFSDLTERVWRVQDGLTDQVVQALAQTPDHYLWVGTSRGLLQFDGTGFTRYAGPEADHFRHGVTVLKVTRDGSLYIGTEGRGLFRLSNEVMEAFGPESGLLNQVIRAVEQDTQGRIWVATDAGVYHSNSSSSRNTFSRAISFPSAALAVANSGEVISGGPKLFKITPTGSVTLPMPKEHGALRIKSLFSDQDGSLWVGTQESLYHLRGGHLDAVHGVPGGIRTILRLQTGQLLVGTAGDGLFTEEYGKFVPAKSFHLPNDTVLTQMVDIEGNLWTGTQSGLARFSHSGIHRTDLPGSANTDFGTVMRDADNSVWFASRSVFHLHGDHGEPVTFPAAGGATIRSLLRERSGALWLATAGNGAFRIQGAKAEKIGQVLGVGYVRGFLQARDGAVWIATDVGVSVHRNGTTTNLTTTSTNEGPHTLILSLAEDHNGDIWAGSLHGLYRLHNSVYSDGPPELEMRKQAVWAILADEDGSLWIGADDGLFRWKDGVLKPVAISLDPNAPVVYTLLRANDDMVWVAGPTRVVRLSLSELRHIADGKPTDADTQVFSVSNDLPSVGLHGGMPVGGVIGDDGTAWFATSQGPIHIVPREAPKATSEVPLHITQVRVDGRSMPQGTSFTLAPDTRTLEIEFAPIELGPHSNFAYRYRLAGFDDWHPLSRSRSAIYTSLPPGHYTFEVELLANGLRPFGRTQPLLIVQAARFYRRPWFWVLSALIVALIAWGLHRVRVYDLRRSHLAEVAAEQAKSDERSRLAREMHDTVIQGCSAVSAILEAEPNSSLLMGHAREQMRALINDARAAVWDLRTYDRAIQPLKPLLTKLAEESTRGSALKVELDLENTPFALDDDVTHELLMTVREAVLNAMAHSEAKTLLIHAVSRHGRLHISVVDDGCGFDTAAAALPNGMHFGLTGMRERIERVHGTFTIESNASPAERGTRVVLDIPVMHRTNRFRRENS